MLQKSNPPKRSLTRSMPYLISEAEIWNVNQYIFKTKWLIQDRHIHLELSIFHHPTRLFHWCKWALIKKNEMMWWETENLHIRQTWFELSQGAV